MVEEKLRGLSEMQSALVQRVLEEVGEVAASSLELVLRKGPKAKRFQAINLVQFRKICILAEEAGIDLPTKEI